MIQSIKKYLAIRGYVRRLGNDLVRRFGRRTYYSVDQVSQAVQRGKYPAEQVIYAHAAYCRLEDFENFYQASGRADRWGKLRQIISRRYLGGQFDFDAGTILSRYGRPGYSSGDHYESGIGFNDSGGGGHH